jgi:hypothetical protein
MPNSSGSRSSGLIHRWVPPAANVMSVSFEGNDARQSLAVGDTGETFEVCDSCDATAAARVAIPAMVERPKSVRQARRSLLIRMFAFGQVRCKHERYLIRERLVPLSNLHEPCGGGACNAGREQRQSTKQNVSQALWWGSKRDTQDQCGSHLCSSRRTHLCSHVPSTRRPSQTGVHLPSLQAMAGHIDAGGASRRLPLGKTSTYPFIHTGVTIQGEDSH